MHAPITVCEKLAQIAPNYRLAWHGPSQSFVVLLLAPRRVAGTPETTTTLRKFWGVKAEINPITREITHRVTDEGVVFAKDGTPNKVDWNETTYVLVQETLARAVAPQDLLDYIIPRMKTAKEIQEEALRADEQRGLETGAFVEDKAREFASKRKFFRRGTYDRPKVMAKKHIKLTAAYAAAVDNRERALDRNYWRNYYTSKKVPHE